MLFNGWTGLFGLGESVGMWVVEAESPTIKVGPGGQNPVAKEQIRIRQYDFTEIDSIFVLPYQNPAFHPWLPQVVGVQGGGRKGVVQSNNIWISVDPLLVCINSNWYKKVWWKNIGKKKMQTVMKGAP